MNRRKKRNTATRQKKQSLITHYEPKSPISEQYRTIRTNIQFSAIDSDLHTLVVTSSAPGEGKTTTATNLAVAMAQQGTNTLLIDSDMRNPSVHYTFQQNNTQGLSNILTRQAAVDDVVYQTDVEALDIMTSGPIPPNPAELLGAHSMNDVITAATASYDKVIFDTPPVLAVTDAQIIAHRCEGTILVIYSGQTETEAATKAKEQLEQANVHIIGTVLNYKQAKKNRYYYYYG